MENGVILLLGCDHESNTTLHYVEELLGSNYHLYPKLATATIRTGDVEFARRFFLHRYGTARSFSRIEPLLRERNLQAQGIVGQAAARLMSATDLVSLATDALRAAPNFFISDIPAQERAI
jgi:aminoglycoside 3-N-acetyltransferase